MMDVSNDLERMRDYVGGRLNDDDRRAFEERLARDPNLVKELERSIRLQEGLHELQAQDRLAVLTPSPRLFLRWASLAAAAAVAAMALVLWRQPHVTLPSSAPSVLSALAPRSGPAAVQYTFVAMRDGSVPVLTPPPQGTVEFRVEAASNAQDTRYRAVLTRDDTGTASPVGTLDGLGRAADGFVHFYAEAPRLAPGHYVLELSPDPASGSTRSFAFDVRAAG